MQASLNALADELRRLKAGGVKRVVVSDEAMVALRNLVRARKPETPAPFQTPSRPAASASSAPASQSAQSAQSAPSASQSAPPASQSAPVSQTVRSAPQSASPASQNAPAPVVYSQLRQPTARAHAPRPQSAATLPPPPVFTLPDGDKKTRWDALIEQVTTNPVCLKHVRPNKKVVLGVGSLDAKIFFCGEAPGAEEEIQGEPFVGPAGQLLTKMIQAMGVKRGDVYIGNIMNWRPEIPVAPGVEQIGNRPPTEEEMGYCMPYLRAQLEIVNPELIVALGATAAKGLLGANSFTTLSSIRGRWHQFEGKPLMITYHPSYILRTPTNRTKRAIWEDFLKIMEKASLPVSDKQRGYFLASHS
ncbi:MAG: uracil-DNA glycosylase [Opitutaceae bacterium]|nr:uracil-DNA glycosylase [Opitutaceae bacterium]